MRSLFLPVLVVAVFLTACGSSASTKAPNDTVSAADVSADALADAATATDAAPVADTDPNLEIQHEGSDEDVLTPDVGENWGNPDCDPLLPGYCALPWPSNKFLVKDATRKTGFALNFGATSLPINVGGVAVNPEPYQRLDGYSITSPLLVVFPGVDISQMAQQTSVGLSMETTATLVWLEVDETGKVLRHIPYWVELDARAPTTDDKDPETGAVTQVFDTTTQLLFVRPAVVLDYARRYIVAFRNLKDKTGNPVARSQAFQALLTGKTAGTPLAERQARFDDTFAVLGKAGIAKDDLTLAWDFNTESGGALHDRVLELREKSFAATGPKGPEITVLKVLDGKDGSADADVAYTLRGTFHAPSFVTKHLIGGDAKHPVYGWRWNIGKDGQLAQDGWRDAPFIMTIPKSALDGTTPHDLLQYGHGLLGGADEIFSHWAGPNANQRHFLYFGSDMIGMADEDNATVLEILNNINEWPCLPERVSQGLVEHLLLARAMQQRAADLQFFKDKKIKLSGQMYYSGNSQGGIYGQTLMALSQDIERGHVGQPGANYSLLLERSQDFEAFGAMLGGVYPNRNDYIIVVTVMQLLWDQVDPVSYVRHIEQEPFAGQKAHRVLAVLHPGDFQVDPLSDEVTARSGWYKIMGHYGRNVFGVPESSYPQQTSAIVAINFGNTWNEKGNLSGGQEPGKLCGNPDQDGGACVGASLCGVGVFQDCTLDDPHDRAHGLKAHNDQMTWFFHTGEIKDFCGGDGCNPE